jgi:hypothetical protein
MGSVKWNESRPSFTRTLLPSTLTNSSVSGVSYSPGATQWPMTAGPIVLLDLVQRVRRELYFVLDDAGWPEQADDIDLGRLSDAGQDLACARSEEARRRNRLELLPDRAGLHFDLRADAGAVVVESGQRQPNRVTGVAAVVSQADGRRDGIGDDEVGVVVAIGSPANTSRGCFRGTAAMPTR